MAITNPQASKFANEQVRPQAERIRALKAEIDAMMVQWFGGMAELIPDSAQESLEDGREAQGVSRLTGADIRSFIVVAQALQTTLDTAGYAGVISKPTVRPMRAE